MFGNVWDLPLGWEIWGVWVCVRPGQEELTWIILRLLVDRISINSKFKGMEQIWNQKKKQQQQQQNKTKQKATGSKTFFLF